MLKHPDRIVIHMPTARGNPLIRADELEREKQTDPDNFLREYAGEWPAGDISQLFQPEAVRACVVKGCFEIAPGDGVRRVAFTDPSGGSVDEMTLAVGRAEGSYFHLDCLRARKPPFSPDEVVKEFCGVLESYGISEVTGDRYGGEWPRERFRVNGIGYKVAEKTRSEYYLELLPLVNSGRVRLIDNALLISQLSSLERKSARGGRDAVDHPPNAHDDVANSVAGVLVEAAKGLTERSPTCFYMDLRAPHPDDLSDPRNDFGFEARGERVPRFR